MNVCLYMRMSTNLQENSIESQQKILQAYAKAHNMYIINEYIDEGISGRKADKRPAFMQMVEDSEKKLFDAVLIYDSSRFARNLEESIVYKSILNRNGVSLISATEPTLDEDTSLMTDALLGAMNEMYSRKLSKTVKRGMEFRIEQGYFQNKPPYGYISNPQKGGIAQIDESKAEIVRKIFNMFTTTTPTFLGIAKELNETGIRTQSNNYWLIKDIRRILKNVSYIGYIPWHSAEYKGKHEPIISEEIFYKAQEIISKKPKNKRDSLSYSHWLSGIIQCGFCGKNMGFNPQNKRTARFRCIGNARGLCYPTNSLSTKKAEKMIEQVLNDIIKGDFEIKKENIIFNIDNDNKSHIVELENKLQKLQRRLKRHKQAYEEEIDTIEEYRQNKKATQKEIDEINNQLTAASVKKFDNKIVDSIKDESLSLLDVLFNDKFSIMQKNVALRKVIHHIVYDKNADKFGVFFNF